MVFFEVINNPFIGSKHITQLKLVTLDSNREYMRTSLKESLINNLSYIMKRRQKDSIKLFEISDIYVSDEEITSKKMLGIIMQWKGCKKLFRFFQKN